MSVTLREDIERRVRTWQAENTPIDTAVGEVLTALRLPDDPPIELVPKPLATRERFAMAAMQGLLANGYYPAPQVDLIARLAVAQADALIAALEKK